MNDKDRSSVIRAKQNEMIDNGLEEFYGNPTSSKARSKMRKVYEKDYFFVKPQEEITDALERTTIPKYVRLAQFLRDVSFKINKDMEKARVLLAKEDNNRLLEGRRLRTVYREFKKIDKRAERLTNRRRRQLSKFKDVNRFIRNDLDKLILKFEKAGLSSHFSSISELTEFFDNCEELQFLNNSKLTKNIR